MGDIGPISQRQPLLIRLNEKEREKLQALADHWGLPLAAAVRRLIREAKVN